MQKLVAFLVLALISLGLLTQCFPRDNEVAFTYRPNYRQPLASAPTAQVWLERRQKDLEISSEAKLDFLYAELPPKAEWPQLFEKLGNAPEGLEETTVKFWQKKNGDLKEKLLVALLKGDAAQAERLSRKLVLASRLRSYSRDESRNLILHLSRDSAEGLRWIKTNAPSLLDVTERSHSSNKDQKEEWEEALAANEVQKGIKLLWEKTEGAPKIEERRKAFERLLTLARVLEDKALSGKASNSYLKFIEEEYFGETESDEQVSLYNFSELIAYLVDQGRWEKVKVLNEKLNQLAEKRNSFYRKEDYPSLSLLAEISLAKDTAQSLASVKSLITESTLEELLESLSYTPNRKLSLGDEVIRVLAAEGEEDLARDLALYLLAQEPGQDRHYERVLQMDRQLLIDFLPRLLIYDPFEERPLIWQSEIALEDNDLAKAEELINQAIALDPSDGEQGKNTRMYCYDVLARIREKQGNQEKADFFFDVVKSIREGEAADDFLYAGLIQEATERYEAALGKFSDAYCLQSRLAMTLAKANRFEEAIPHFEKAFELMPVSFGPRESHCLGCEGIFHDKRVQAIAERILNEFVEKNPENPRAPYLLGMVFAEMGNDKGAISAFQKALELDPNYYNCATRLESLYESDPVYFGELRKLQKQLVGIAPYPELPSAFQSRTDLATLFGEATQVPPSPLQLPVLPTLKGAAKTEQYTNIYFSSWRRGEAQALLGWQRADLLLSNKLLDCIDYIN